MRHAAWPVGQARCARTARPEAHSLRSPTCQRRAHIQLTCPTGVDVRKTGSEAVFSTGNFSTSGSDVPEVRGLARARVGVACLTQLALSAVRRAVHNAAQQMMQAPRIRQRAVGPKRSTINTAAPVARHLQQLLWATAHMNCSLRFTVTDALGQAGSTVTTISVRASHAVAVRGRDTTACAS